MRSNGAVHLGNNTFAVALRGVDSALHLVTPAFSDAADRCVYFPFDAPTTFSIRTTLAPAPQRLAADADKDADGKDGAGLVRSPTRQFRSTATPHRHVLLASDDGRHIAAISTETTQHFILNMQNIPVSKCALETDELVRSVCWHPTRAYVLLVLLASGRIVVYDVRYYPLGVVLPIARELDTYKYIPLKYYARRSGPWVKKETIDSTIEPFTLYSAVADANRAIMRGTGGAAKDPVAISDKEKEKGPFGTAAVRSSAVPQNMFGYRNAAGLFKGTAGPSTATAKATVFSEDGADGVPLPITKEEGEDDEGDEAETAAAAAHAGDEKATAAADATPREAAGADESGGPPRTVFAGARQLRGREILRLTAPLDPGRAEPPASEPAPPGTLLITAPTDARPEVPELVDATIVRPTRSLPPTLLLLTALGDVYSCKIDHEGLPTTDIASGVEHKPSAPPPFLTHKICYLVDSGLDEAETEPPRDVALAARSCHIDVERELHAVVTVFNTGRAKIAYVSESDLIGQPRDRQVPVLAERQAKGVADYSVSVQLGPPVDAGAYLSMEVPTTTHLVQMGAQGNVCLVRYGSEGAVFLIALPVWLSGRGWCYLARGDEAARAPATPIVSTDAMVVPTPLSFRLPFATKGKSVTLSASQLLVVPEEVAPTVATEPRVTRADVVTLDLLQLVRAAMYGTLGAITRVGHAPQGKEAPKEDTEKKPAAAGSAWAHLDESLELAKRAHAAFFERVSETDQKKQMETQTLLEACTTAIERANEKTSKRFKDLVGKQTRLRLAREELERNVQLLASQIEVERTTILNGIAHRRGVRGIEEANEKLNTMHKILSVVEERLDLT
ncbi:hypothetical protein STCU_10934 [Strigomonas culicis]|uniref:Uncharacterized protein n=1 Tax=Strigomonas culicis TaxID=28005 RepID=S9V222_9TRYP|nr:hypothetical protein STCU_10934 [Strigomonas culicis]|eukprot:EPY16875.1 hypothetical protein STCU_10934 [Strigomonas culicis]